MITASQAFTTVQNRERLPLLKGEDRLTTVYNIIITHINEGWLGCNLYKYLHNSDKLFIIRKLKDLGYSIDSEYICYWTHNPINVT